ncbi:PPE-repeat containing protein (plasmid) [Mycolicibacterium chubuense NBB4]|uniref:PPE-repeat containing protein n=1 Tax=Mycolicibacterium chubuense (strain NBB4) TaxID=710421 RepID=I4BSF2_MYCCN|nr:PPE domain-containing protein [Mycolicibacterium chubuense]AFM20209.1 PPE-repeat containing protein [Mycolicibacterium chubuense NBB4]
MAVNYWGITPEINAIRLTTGPGAAAMASVIAGYQAAGVTHMEQGAQMMTTAATTATGSWWGQGGTAMMAAAVPKSEWQIEAGAHAEKATGMIGAAAAAHTGAVAATIPYPVCVANRVREATLQATNFMGFNTPAILQTDAEYGEYHAQNATAMTGYFTAALDLIAGMSTPLRPPMVTGANPAALAGGMASMGAQGVQTGVQAATQGLSAPMQAAGQVASAAPAALSAATSAATGQSGADGDVGTTGAPLAQQGGSDLLGSSQSMMGMASSLPSMAQGMTQPLSQLAQAPLQMGGQLSGLMGSMGGMGGGPFGGLSANAPGANLAASMNGVSGGFGSGGGPVTAALTKPAGVGMGGGPIGTPSAWWGPAAVDGSGAAGQNKPTAGARAAVPGMGTGAPMGSGMGGMMPMGAAQAGQRRDQAASRGQDDTSLSVVLDDADAIPILTANGVVYTDGGG